MDQLLSLLLSLSFLIFCLGLAALTFIVRTLVEFWVLRSNRVWRDLILPLLPVVSGGLVAWLTPGYAYPEMIGSEPVGRVFFGVVAGLFSGLVYRLIISLIKGKTDAKPE